MPPAPWRPDRQSMALQSFSGSFATWADEQTKPHAESPTGGGQTDGENYHHAIVSPSRLLCLSEQRAYPILIRQRFAKNL